MAIFFGAGLKRRLGETGVFVLGLGGAGRHGKTDGFSESNAIIGCYGTSYANYYLTQIFNIIRPTLPAPIQPNPRFTSSKCVSVNFAARMTIDTRDYNHELAYSA